MTPLVFVVPEMRASISGGNLYNLGLTAALGEAGVALRVVTLDEAEAALRAPHRACLVDSLYLAALPRLARARKHSAPLLLLAHWLPSLVERGALASAAELSPAERDALAAVDGFVAPSVFLARELERLAPPGRNAIVVPPAIDLPQDARADHAPHQPMCAIVVANLVPGKGVLPFLQAIVPHLREGAPLSLTIAGSLESDPAHAAACRACVAGDPLLAQSVCFTGALPHAATLERVAASDLFVSASRMESFGLAIAEARALGVPIVARAGGNVAALVDARAGGRLCDSDDALAAECARLARDPIELAARRRAAQAARLPRRAWSEAAAELDAALPAPARERASE
jgi:glycosyltransferase involved in cell wall biosynthesis